MKYQVEDTTKKVVKVFDDLVAVRKYTRLSMAAIKNRLAGVVPIQSPKKPSRYIIKELVD